MNIINELIETFKIINFNELTLGSSLFLVGFAGAIISVITFLILTFSYRKKVKKTIIKLKGKY